ncbi:MAG: enoyl-CoA hydratase/isomerase family protein, partial [Gammaproteobacteria bacterium]|nr:enoyl-CoA hydratase/isomerase family protein [Gammaproteobacteria bacterium]
DMKSNEFIEGVSDTGGRVTLAMFECKKPIIGAINGAAVGIGATMLCAMDMRMASSKARIGFVFEKIGITQEACSSWFLPRIVGISRALEWTYTGEIFNADTALQTGFVRSVHEPDQLLDDAYALARQITDKSQVSIALARQMMWRLDAANHPRDAHDIDSLAIFYQSQTESKEGIAAFLEKRPANFTGKASTDMPPFYPWWK